MIAGENLASRRLRHGDDPLSPPERGTEEGPNGPSMPRRHEGRQTQGHQVVNGRHQGPGPAAGELEARDAVEDVDGTTSEITGGVPERPEEPLGPRETPHLCPGKRRPGSSIDV